MKKTALTIVSWNVNGIRAAMKNSFADWLATTKPDLVALQEIKIDDAARAQAQFDFAGYHEYWHPAKRPGYSGTAVLSRIEPLNVIRGLGGADLDDEGRVLTLEFKQFYLVNTYFPNAKPDLARLDYKEDFNRQWLAYVKKLEQQKPVVAGGDYNVAREAIDLARPKDNEGHSGFTKEERAWADKFLAHGLIDTYRLIHGDKIQYSWWSYRFFARAKNLGWRIDYWLVSDRLKTKVKDAFIQDTVLGSDHAPVGLILTL